MTTYTGAITTIASFDGGGYPGQFMGPFYFDGKIFAVLSDDNYSHVYASHDMGATWAESDSANAPAHKNQTGSWAGLSAPLALYRQSSPAAIPGTSILYVAFAENDLTISLGRFDMASLTWMTKITGGPAVVNGLAADGTGSFPMFRLEVTPRGKLALAYNSVSSAHTCISMAFYDCCAWGAPFIASGSIGVSNRYLDSIVPGQHDEVHVFWLRPQDSSDPSDVSFTSKLGATVVSLTGTVGSPVDIVDTAIWLDDIWNGRFVDYPENNILVPYAAWSPHNDGYGTVAGVSTGGAITWTDTHDSQEIAIWFGEMFGSGYMGRGRHYWGNVRTDDGVLHSFAREGLGTGETFIPMIWGQSTGSGWTWTQIVDSLPTYQVGNISPATLPGGQIGVIFSDANPSDPAATTWQRSLTKFLLMTPVTSAPAAPLGNRFY